MMRSVMVSARVAVVAALLALCAGCVPSNPGSGGPASGPASGPVQQQQDVVDGVQSADAAATAVVAEQSTSGTSMGWSVEIDHEGELTADTLADVLRAVADSDLEPVDVTLYFFAPGTDDPLDIAPAADELGVPWTRVGSGASWLTGQLGDLPE